MNRKLQNKFIFYTISISAMSLIIIMSFINVNNYVSIINGADQKIEVIVSNDFKFEHKPPRILKRELPSFMNFFTVYFDENSNITKIISNVDEYMAYEDVVSYSETIIKEGKSKGIIDGFRYLKTVSNNRQSYVFLDIQRELYSCMTFMVSSIYIVVIALILITIIAILLSKRAVSPIIESYERQKSFITNVSHEFKTPLAIIKADSDVIEIENGESEWTGSINNQISKLNNLVDNLISLTKLDENKVNIIKSDFSLTDALYETINEFSSVMQNSNIGIELVSSENITYNGNEESIRKLFEILIENAMKYASKNTNVRITLKNYNSKIYFSIENESKNLKIGKYNNCFERFYREDKSRNSEVKGSGIGLSIAKSICKNHDAKIRAYSNNGISIVIEIIF